LIYGGGFLNIVNVTPIIKNDYPVNSSCGRSTVYTSAITVRFTFTKYAKRSKLTFIPAHRVFPLCVPGVEYANVTARKNDRSDRLRKL